MVDLLLVFFSSLGQVSGARLMPTLYNWLQSETALPCRANGGNTKHVMKFLTSLIAVFIAFNLHFKKQAHAA